MELLTAIDHTVEQNATRLFHSVLGHKFLFASTAVVVFAAVMVGGLSLAPKYQSNTLLLTRSGADTPSASSGTGAKPDDYTPPRTLVEIAQSDDVIRQAAADVGVERLVQNTEEHTPFFLMLRSKLFGSPYPSLEETDDRWLTPVKEALEVRAEPNSDVISIAYRHRDPTVARAFVAAMAQRFMDKQIALYTHPGAADFFRAQTKKFEEAYRQASDRLAQFASASGTYEADEQRKLLLKRASDLTSNFAVTEGNVTQERAERDSLGTQLHLLAPVARSHYVSTIVDQLVGRAPPPADGALRNDASNPPLLLVKVYQDLMSDLFKLNSQIAGGVSLQTQQANQLTQLTSSLNDLSKNEQKYFQLKRELDRASEDANTYSKRMVEEEIAAAYAASIHSIKLIQSASTPIAPVFPNYKLLCVAALAISLLCASAVTLFSKKTHGSR